MYSTTTRPVCSSTYGRHLGLRVVDGEGRVRRESQKNIVEGVRSVVAQENSDSESPHTPSIFHTPLDCDSMSCGGYGRDAIYRCSLLWLPFSRPHPTGRGDNDGMLPFSFKVSVMLFPVRDSVHTVSASNCAKGHTGDDSSLAPPPAPTLPSPTSPEFVTEG